MNEHGISALQLILILDAMGDQVRAAKEADTIQESLEILNKLEEQMSSLKEDIGSSYNAQRPEKA